MNELELSRRAGDALTSSIPVIAQTPAHRCSPSVSTGTSPGAGPVSRLFRLRRPLARAESLASSGGTRHMVNVPSIPTGCGGILQVPVMVSPLRIPDRMSWPPTIPGEKTSVTSAWFCLASASSNRSAAVPRR